MSGIWPKESAKCSQVIDFGSELDLIEDKVNKTIDCHLFSRNIQLISSNSQMINLVKQHIKSTESLSYFLVKDIPIHLFVNNILINGFVKSGQLFAVSVGKQIDTEDCLALLPKGILVLSVKESTYKRIGIVGKKSILYRKKNCIQKYLIEINLNNEHMTPDTKFYKRYDECLRRSGLVFDVFIKWEVTNEELKSKDISSISIQKLFSYLKTNCEDNSLSNIQWFRCLPSLESHSNSCAPIPPIREIVTEEDIRVLIEWFGSQLCQIDCEVSEETDISTFGITDCERRDDIHCLSINGFFTSHDIKSIFNEIRKSSVKSDNSLTAFLVNGFEDSCVCWIGKNNEHSKNLSGENMYGITISNNLSFIWRIADEYDFGVERL